MADNPRLYYRLVEPYVPGCPYPMMDEYIRDIATEFCERTAVWREVVETAYNNNAFVKPTLPKNSLIHDIEAAWFDDEPLEPAPYSRFGPSELARTDAVPRFITQAELDQVTVVPRGVGTLKLNLILKPPLGDLSPNVELPNILLRHHAQAIADGALARLMMMPGKGWSNPGQAAIHRAAFDMACEKLSTFRVQGQQRTPMRTRARFI